MKSVVFDVGNVLIRWDVKALYRQMLGSEVEIDAFLAETQLLDWNDRFDRGLPFADGVTELSKRFPHYAELFRAFDVRWGEMVPGPIDGSVLILHELAEAGIPLYAITNFATEKWTVAQSRFAFLSDRYFRDIVISGHEKVAKPAPAIYQILCDRNGLDPSDCTFIDDAKSNAEGAMAVGMEAIHFSTPERLRAELVARKLL